MLLPTGVVDVFEPQSFVTLRINAALKWMICLLMEQKERNINDGWWFTDNPWLNPETGPQVEWHWQSASCVLDSGLSDALAPLPPYEHTRTRAHVHMCTRFTLKSLISTECMMWFYPADRAQMRSHMKWNVIFSGSLCDHICFSAARRISITAGNNNLFKFCSPNLIFCWLNPDAIRLNGN